MNALRNGEHPDEDLLLGPDANGTSDGSDSE